MEKKWCLVISRVRKGGQLISLSFSQEKGRGEYSLVPATWQSTLLLCSEERAYPSHIEVVPRWRPAGRIPGGVPPGSTPAVQLPRHAALRAARSLLPLVVRPLRIALLPPVIHLPCLQPDSNP